MPRGTRRPGFSLSPSLSLPLSLFQSMSQSPTFSQPWFLTDCFAMQGSHHRWCTVMARAGCFQFTIGSPRHLRLYKLSWSLSHHCASSMGDVDHVDNLITTRLFLLLLLLLWLLLITVTLCCFCSLSAAVLLDVVHAVLRFILMGAAPLYIVHTEQARLIGRMEQRLVTSSR